MDFNLSLDWIFIALTLASVVFLLQILRRHAEEMEKVEALLEEAQMEAGELDKPLSTLESRNEELESTLKALEKESEK